MSDTIDLFTFFVNGDWHYESQKILDVLGRLSVQDREEFDCDCRKLDWPKYLSYYVKGLSIWALNEDQVEPSHGLDQIMLKNYKLFDNVRFTLGVRESFIEKDSIVYERGILNEQRFYDFVNHNEINDRVASSAIKKAHRYDQKAISKELERMRC